MSIHILSAVYAAQLGGPLRKAVALKLADHANDDGGSVYPSLGRLAAESEVSKSTAQRAIKDFLDEEGDVNILEVVERGGFGPRDTTEYRFRLENLHKLPRTWSEKKAVLTDHLDAKARWSGGREKMVTRPQKGGQAATTEPSLNRQRTKTRSGAKVFADDLASEGKAISKHLRQLFRGRQEQYMPWVGVLRFRRDGGRAIAEAPTSAVSNHVQKYFVNELDVACRAQWPDIVRVDVIVRKPTASGLP